RTREGAETPACYRDAAEFEQDLLLVWNSLMAHRGERLARTYIGSLLRMVRKFGFHLHTLDIRQHARVHAQVLKELGSTPRPNAESAATVELLETFRSEEHTSELQSHHDLVCRLLLEKKKNAKRAQKTLTKIKNKTNREK